MWEISKWWGDFIGWWSSPPGSGKRAEKSLFELEFFWLIIFVILVVVFIVRTK